MGRAQTEHSAFPQLRQKPVASTSGWTAHFIESSLRNRWGMRLQERWSAKRGRSRDSVAWAKREKRRCGRDLFREWIGASWNPDCSANRRSAAAWIEFHKRREDR